MSSPVRRSQSRRSLLRPASRSSTRSGNNFQTGKDDDQQSSPSPSCAEHVPGLACPPSIHPSPSGSEGESVQDPWPPSPAQPHVPKQTRFGIHVPPSQPRVIGNFDFEEKYPEDPIYEELGPNARVWRANLDECEVYDNEMVTEARDGLDLLLVFAGLFSAVLTTFVTQTSQALSNNLPAVSTSLLLEMVKLQRALINGTSIDNVPVSEMSSGPSGFDVWVNGLWLISLTLSLGTALMAVLVKQWLFQYMSNISGTARDRSLIRFYRFDGLRKWHVLTIIGILPIALHVALGLFLAGLVIFLIPLNIPLAIIIGLITLVIYSTYAISNILPILYTQCPYRTPFSDILNVMLHPLLAFLSSADTSRAFHSVVYLVRAFSPSVTAVTIAVKRLALPIRTFLISKVAPVATRVRKFFPPSTPATCPAPNKVFRSLKEAERIAATCDDAAEEVASDALVWLYQITSNLPTKSVVLQSIGCFSDKVSERLGAISAHLEPALEKNIQWHHMGYWTIRPTRESRTERLLRANFTHTDDYQSFFWCCKLDEEGGLEYPFHLPISVMIHSPSLMTDSSRGPWTRAEFLYYIVQRYNANTPILLPSLLWRKLFNPYIDGKPLMLKESESLNVKPGVFFKLCDFALRTFVNHLDTMPKANLFSGGVPITHHTVPLFELITNLPHFKFHSDCSVSSEALRRLFAINDAIVIDFQSTYSTPSPAHVLPLLTYLWDLVGSFDELPQTDKEAICYRAKDIIYKVCWQTYPDFPGIEDCYNNIIRAYQKNTYDIESHEAFRELIFDLIVDRTRYVVSRAQM